MKNAATCSARHKTLGRCQQPPLPGRVQCSVHYRMDNDPRFRVDKHYHEKIILGLLEPTDRYLSVVEIEALFRGRPRNDGRRLDHWTR